MLVLACEMDMPQAGPGSRAEPIATLPAGYTWATTAWGRICREEMPGCCRYSSRAGSRVSKLNYVSHTYRFKIRHTRITFII